jgi:glycosyltransferase involved in cell wall biosynthesis
VDLAFRVREAGYEVLYQPASVVIHWEGISSGRESDTGIKAFQIVNERVFRERWAAVLQTHAPRGERPLLVRDRGCKKRALFIDATTPTPDQDAGSNVAVAHMRILQSLGYKVTFIPAHNFAFASGYTPALQRIGIEAIYRPAYNRLDCFLEDRGDEFDLAYVHRFEVGEEAIPLLRRHAPGATIIFNTADLHYLRLERGAHLSGSAVELDQARRIRQRELAVIRAADCTLICNSREMEILRRETPDATLYYLPWVMEVERRAVPDFAAREGFLFLGGFGHPPNVDAVRSFVTDVMPHVRRLLPGVCFHVYGSKMPAVLRDLAGADVIIEGFAPDVRAVFDRHRVTVAPLRYGAGFKGKVATSLAHSVPVVASPIAVEGTGLRDNNQLLVASDPIGLARALQQIYTDRALWERLSVAGRRYLNEHFSFERGREHFINILNAPSSAKIVNVPAAPEFMPAKKEALTLGTGL